MNPQAQSPLFLVPNELRLAVYSILIPKAIHLFLRNGKVAIAACNEPAVDLDGYERRTTGDRQTDTTWIRRLQSSWGPHWECEENATRQLDDTSHQTRDASHVEVEPILLFVCNRMSMEVLDFMSTTATVHVTDIETLHSLVNGSLGSCLGDLGRSLTRLNITLRAPLEFFWALSNLDLAPLPPGKSYFIEVIRSHADAVSKTRPWTETWSSLHKMQCLQSLTIWLDHNQPRGWGGTDEISALRNVASSLSNNPPPHLKDIVISLPSGFSAFQRDTFLRTSGAERESVTQQNSSNWLTINRRNRQKFHAKELGCATFYVVHEDQHDSKTNHPPVERVLLSDIAAADPAPIRNSFPDDYKFTDEELRIIVEECDGVIGYYQWDPR